MVAAIIVAALFCAVSAVVVLVSSGVKHQAVPERQALGVASLIKRGGPSCDDIYRVVLSRDPFLLICAMDHGSMSTDTWWRLCEGRFTRGLQQYLPGLTDANLLKFVKAYQSGTLKEPDDAAALREAGYAFTFPNGRAGDDEFYDGEPAVGYGAA